MMDLRPILDALNRRAVDGKFAEILNETCRLTHMIKVCGVRVIRRWWGNLKLET
jgi:hypothetical protein